LVERLPVIPCPSWSRNLTQPVALDDVLRLLRHCLEHSVGGNRSFDIGSPDVMSYRELLERTARLLRLKRRFFRLPISGTFWCRQWLCLVTGAPRDLAAPLIESVRHSLVCADRHLQESACVPGIPFDVAVQASVAREKVMTRRGEPLKPLAHAPWRALYLFDVRSVQRMPLPRGRSARWAAEQYSAWLPRFFRVLLRVDVDHQRNVRFRLPFTKTPLVELTFARDRSAESSRQVFYITGGVLVRAQHRAMVRPRLEFREVLGGRVLLVAIHDYRPALPWPVYGCTQALVHLWAMRGFARYLAQLDPAAE